MSSQNWPGHLPRPTFVAIGPGKSGTTWLYHAVRQHPEVCVSSVKETLFFEDEYARGPGWYARFFRHYTAEPQLGEVSNTYIFSPDAPKRMAAFNPAFKLIATLRSPAERAFSHYLFLRRNGRVRGSFEDAIESHPDIVERGYYSRLLNRYLDHFPKEQLCVLVFDDLKRDANSYARTLFSFLGVSEHVADQLSAEARLPASKPRNAVLARVAKELGLAVRRTGYPEVVGRIKESALMTLLFVPYAKHEYPAMHPDTRERLEELYADDVQQLSTLFGRDFGSLWRVNGSRTTQR